MILEIRGFGNIKLYYQVGFSIGQIYLSMYSTIVYKKEPKSKGCTRVFENLALVWMGNINIHKKRGGQTLLFKLMLLYNYNNLIFGPPKFGTLNIGSLYL